MSGTTSRALDLLNLLQSLRHWSGTELAARLGVTERTVRRDVERLRDLGYRIDSHPGVGGGYRLEAGTGVPPLLLTDDEAVAMAIGLRVAASDRLVGGPQTTLTALAKLEQVLPVPLRRRVSALAQAVRPPGAGQGEPVATEVLADLALATRDHERVRFDYRSASGEETRRHVEPHALAPADRNWYLLCWDLDRSDWRTFRVDRIADVGYTRVRFTPRPLTPEEVDEFVLVARASAGLTFEADVVMELPLETTRDRFGQWAQGATAEDPDRTRWPIGGGDVRDAMYGMSWIPAGVEYRTDLAEPERTELREIVARMLRCLDGAPPAPRSADRVPPSA